MSNDKKLKITLSRGLVGQDDNIDTLISLFELLQLATVEAADPGLDLITFAQSAHYFAVILGEPVKTSSTQDEDQSEEQNYTEQLNNYTEETQDWQGNNVGGVESTINPFLHPQDSDETLVNPPPSPSPSASTEESENSWPGYDNGNAWGTNFGANFAQTNYPSYPLYTRNDNRMPIGLVYLTASQNFGDPMHVGQLSIGIILDPKYRGKGYAREVVSRVASIAFDEEKCHRLQAILIGHVAMDRALSLFTKTSFAHEGTRRRSFFSPMEHEWQDVTYMAILDTDWVMRETRILRSAPKSLWDALFARHQREREDLLRWEAKATLKRTSSMVTIRGETLVLPPDPAPTPASELDDTHYPTDLTGKGKRKADVLDGPSEPPHDDERLLVKRWVELSSPELSFDDDYSDRSPSPSSSTSWDMMETCSVSSMSSPDSPNSPFFEFVNV